MHIRLATIDDAQAIADIYNLEVLESVVTFDLVARSLEEQREWIRRRSGAHPATVAVNDQGEVVGFGSLSTYKERPAYNTTVEDSVYVARNARGSGVGKQVLEDLITRARSHGFHTVIARIVGDHEASIGLHASLGFTQIGVEREVGRKFGRWLDVAVLQLML